MSLQSIAVYSFPLIFVAETAVWGYHGVLRFQVPFSVEVEVEVEVVHEKEAAVL